MLGLTYRPGASLALFASMLMASSPGVAIAQATAPDTRPVTRDQFRQTLTIMKKLSTRVDELERKDKVASRGAKGAGGAESVNLDDLSTSGPAQAPAGISTMNAHHGGGALGIPGFKVYFDLNLVNRPGYTDLSFLNYHSLLLFELMADSKLQFAFDVNPAPRYYELDYQATEAVQLRAGKIWIPFDDMAPHNIFGGRVNVSKLSIGQAFLPDIWSDLGVGIKLVPIDTGALTTTFHAYVVNGFGSGGRDPVTGKAGNDTYPDLGDTSIAAADNNRDKAIGGRAHFLFGRTFGIGASVYSGRWNSDASSVSSRLNILGVDSQLRFSAVELRSGYALIKAGLPGGDTFNRGGAYGEIGYRFGEVSQWKVLGRAGVLQMDDRVTDDPTDQRIIGATLLWKPSSIEYSFEHSRDVLHVAGKKGYTYTAARLVIAL